MSIASAESQYWTVKATFLSWLGELYALAPITEVWWIHAVWRDQKPPLDPSRCPTFGVLGLVSSGKSTLVNCLLRMGLADLPSGSICPAGVGTTTMVATTIRRGSEWRAYVMDCESGRTHPDDAGDLAWYQEVVRRGVPDGSRLVLESPSPVLQHFTLVDLPGLADALRFTNSAFYEHEGAKLDGIILIVDRNAGILTEDLRNVLVSMITHNPVPFVVFMTKMDREYLEEVVAEPGSQGLSDNPVVGVLQATQDSLRTFKGCLGVFPVSAKDAMTEMPVTCPNSPLHWGQGTRSFEPHWVDVLSPNSASLCRGIQRLYRAVIPSFIGTDFISIQQNFESTATIDTNLRSVWCNHLAAISSALSSHQKTAVLNVPIGIDSDNLREHLLFQVSLLRLVLAKPESTPAHILDRLLQSSRRLSAMSGGRKRVME